MERPRARIGIGRWGYVYSLTRWDERSFKGGETLLFRPDAYWGSARPAAGAAFYELVEPTFNRLLVFDDRLIHGVERLEGNMNPHEGRVVMHGHLREGRLISQGPLRAEEVQPMVDEARARLRDRLRERLCGVTGVLSLRLHLGADGRVAEVDPVLEQLTGPLDEAAVAWTWSEVVAAFSRQAFPARPAGSVVTVPLVVG